MLSLALQYESRGTGGHNSTPNTQETNTWLLHIVLSYGGETVFKKYFLCYSKKKENPIIHFRYEWIIINDCCLHQEILLHVIIFYEA